MTPSVGPVACSIGKPPLRQAFPGIRFEQSKGAFKGSGIGADPKGSTVRQHGGPDLRAADCVPVACIQIPAAFKLHYGEEKGDKRGFGHEKKPAGKRACGKGKG